MIRQDFILRLIEQLAHVLARILALRRAGRHEEALEATDEALQKFVGLDARFIEALSLKDLLSLMKPGIDLDITRCLVVADLLKERSQIYDDQGDAQASFEAQVKALTLFLEIFTSPGAVDLPDRATKTEELIAALEEYELPPETQVRLFRYFEKTGRYSDAEDRLFEMVEDSPDDETLQIEGARGPGLDPTQIPKVKPQLPQTRPSA
jgi:tetratricopeptide (TPR) repeat protein